MKRLIAALACLLVGITALAGCGISADRVPRDIDPQQHEELNKP